MRTVGLVDLLLFISALKPCLVKHIILHRFSFQSCSLVPYLLFVQKTGLSVGPFQLRWYTTSLNRLILKMSFWHPRFQTYWFTFGSWLTICLIVPSVCLVIVSSVQLCQKIFTEPTNEPSANQQDVILKPIVRFIFISQYYMLRLCNFMFLGTWIEFTDIRHSLLCTCTYVFNCFS